MNCLRSNSGVEAAALDGFNDCMRLRRPHFGSTPLHSTPLYCSVVFSRRLVGALVNAAGGHLVTRFTFATSLYSTERSCRMCPRAFRVELPRLVFSSVRFRCVHRTCAMQIGRPQVQLQHSRATSIVKSGYSPPRIKSLRDCVRLMWHAHSTVMLASRVFTEWPARAVSE